MALSELTWKDDHRSFTEACRSRTVSELKSTFDSSRIQAILVHSHEQKSSLLDVASTLGNLALLDFLLDEGADPNAANVYGQTAAFAAAAMNQVDILARLHACGLDLSKLDLNRDSCAFMAAARGHTEALKWILEHVANPKALLAHLNLQYHTPFDIACIKDKTEVVTLLLRRDYDCQPSFFSITRKSPLLHACENGCLDVVKVLLAVTSQLEPEVDVSSRRGDNALSAAASGGHTELVHYLVHTHHFSMSALDTTMTVVGRSNHSDVLSFLVGFLSDHPQSETLLQSAAYAAAGNGRLRNLTILLDTGIADTARERTRLLYMAIDGNQYKALVWLWERFIRDKKSTGVLQKLQNMAFSGVRELRKICQSHELIHKAAGQSDVRIVRFVINVMGMSANQQTINDRSTPLHRACYLRNVAVVRWLLRHSNADPSLRDDDGFTPLHIACGKGNIPIVQLLVGYGASLITRDKQNRTPVGCSVDFELSQYLEQCKRWPPIMIALDSRNMLMLLDNCRSGFYFTQRRQARTMLLEHINQPSLLGNALDEHINETVMHCLQPWSPQVHYLYPKGNHMTALALMIVAQCHHSLPAKANTATWSQSFRSRLGSLRRATPEQDEVNSFDVPVEIWYRILGFVQPERSYCPNGPRFFVCDGD